MEYKYFSTLNNLLITILRSSWIDCSRSIQKRAIVSEINWFRPRCSLVLAASSRRSLALRVLAIVARQLGREMHPWRVRIQSIYSFHRSVWSSGGGLLIRPRQSQYLYYSLPSLRLRPLFHGATSGRWWLLGRVGGTKWDRDGFMLFSQLHRLPAAAYRPHRPTLGAFSFLLSSFSRHPSCRHSCRCSFALPVSLAFSPPALLTEKNSNASYPELTICASGTPSADSTGQ